MGVKAGRARVRDCSDGCGERAAQRRQSARGASSVERFEPGPRSLELRARASKAVAGQTPHTSTLACRARRTSPLGQHHLVDVVWPHAVLEEAHSAPPVRGARKGCELFQAAPLHHTRDVLALRGVQQAQRAARQSWPAIQLCCCSVVLWLGRLSQAYRQNSSNMAIAACGGRAGLEGSRARRRWAFDAGSPCKAAHPSLSA
jgi:hypothetical protein